MCVAPYLPACLSTTLFEVVHILLYLQRQHGPSLTLLGEKQWPVSYCIASSHQHLTE